MSRLAFDMHAGMRSATEALEDRGWQIVRIKIGDDYLRLRAADLLSEHGRPDFVWSSPPCTAFSVAGMGHHWGGGRRAYEPKTEQADEAIRFVAHTLRLMRDLQPVYGWLMENPRGLLRKLPVVEGVPRSTVTYCQYGDTRMKPTDLWGGIGGWLPNRSCSPRASCHEAAPRGSRTGTQALPNALARSAVPYGLSEAVADRLDAVAGQDVVGPRILSQMTLEVN